MASTFTLPLKKTGKNRISQSLETKILLDKQTVSNTAIPKDAESIQVLLVEDNPVNLKVLNKMVQKQGYSTITAENGQQAVDLLEHFKVNLILMDCQMPMMDGFIPKPISQQTIRGVLNDWLTSV
ncbi:MAG: response regulator [Pseudomonadales bacterium]|nr:response regulator [Pseudomonadales bacterium]